MERFKDGIRHFTFILIWLLTIMLAVWFTSCSPNEDIDIYPEPLRVEEGIAFPTINGDQSYIQHVYLDTLQSFTYTQIYAESTDMAESQKYNGESNIHARFSTDSHWLLNNGIIVDYPVYYTYPTAVRFIQYSQISEYKPSSLPLWTKQMVGPIPKKAVVNNDTIKISMNVSFDGDYHVSDSIAIVLHAR